MLAFLANDAAKAISKNENGCVGAGLFGPCSALGEQGVLLNSIFHNCLQCSCLPPSAAL